ncbi:hypothetical protein [Pedobacter faecalis]|uniref:hypothetical protein n=1 Tax=Pedobacter faecalis TaxID=3041495 RepID=UPI00254D5F2F|nr:hypothetical protein [Pedobacter sp. ELA7]
MGFIKHALIGIAIYEAVKYCIRNEHMFRSGTISDDLGVAADPNVSLTGNAPLTAPDDPWKNSLASDELRAPDS